MTLVLALLIGGAFGFVLDRVGASDPGEIIGMLRLTRLRLMKTILMAIGLAAVLTFAGLLVGFVDPAHLSVKTAHFGVVVGGLLLGVGFGAVGYCPGTGLAGAATGRVDAWFFVLGGLVGAAGYMLTHSLWAGSGVLAPVAGGKTTLGPIAGTSSPALIEAVPGEWLGIAVGIAFILIAVAIPDTLRPTPAVRPSGRPLETAR